MPKAQTSEASVNFPDELVKSSGAKYSGVPINAVMDLVSLGDSFLAAPKSQTLTCLFFIKMLASFKSL